MITEIIPVVHYLNDEQVHENIELINKYHLGKVFLINHGYGQEPVAALNKCIKQVQEQNPDLWIGVNYLQLSKEEAIKVAQLRAVDALWVDNAGILNKDDEEQAANFYHSVVNPEYKQTLYFGGVEFKYQRHPLWKDLPDVYKITKEYVDVITTSGDGTGKEIKLDKLERIRNQVGDDKLIAVASGIDKDNIKAISEYANILMVATSITDQKTELIIEEKLDDLIRNLK